VLDAVLSCPVLRQGADVNEIGEDCDGCDLYDPDRAGFCRELQSKGDYWITPTLEVRAVRPGEMGYPWALLRDAGVSQTQLTGEPYSPIREDMDG
ncbi:MAG: hypothetical protein KKH61_20675, partial [Gammaproteobacteria bacterium]|nr:hypothetical protein [Gammaproteobacteria bacterium]